MSGGLGWQLAWRGLASVVLLWVLWRGFGPFGLVFAAPAVGVLMARPLIDLAGELRRQTKALAMRPTDGTMYAFRNHPLRVMDDDEGRRWLAVADLRRIVPGLPAEATLARVLTQGVQRMGTPPAAFVEAEDTMQLLARAQEPATVKLVHWIERDVAGPARRRRETA